MIEILEHHFPTEVAQRIFRYQSHPTADIMRDLIKKSKPYGVEELLHCVHYKRWKCKWNRKLYGCGCRICWEIREACLSKPN